MSDTWEEFQYRIQGSGALLQTFFSNLFDYYRKSFFYQNMYFGSIFLIRSKVPLLIRIILAMLEFTIGDEITPVILQPNGRNKLTFAGKNSVKTFAWWQSDWFIDKFCSMDSLHSFRNGHYSRTHSVIQTNILHPFKETTSKVLETSN